MPLPITSSADYIRLECNKYLSILNKIIFDDLTELLRELLQHSIAISKIEDYYNAVKRKLKKRFTKREEELIFNAPRTGYRPFDITVIAVLLRHFHEKNNVETHITSLMRIRNELCHLTNTNITESQFDIYFGECCDIAFALEEYLKKPKFLVQKFQTIYEVNTHYKKDRIDLQIETVKHSLTELTSSAEIIHNSELDERLEVLEEFICQIDRHTDERHRHVVCLKKCAKLVKKQLESSEQAKQVLNDQGAKPCIHSKSLKYTEEEQNDKTRSDPVLDKQGVSNKTAEKERQKTFKQTLPSFRPTLYLEPLKACGDHGIRKCSESNPTAFKTIKSRVCDKGSLNKHDQSVVHLSGTNAKGKLGLSSNSYMGIVENKRVLLSQSLSVDTVSQPSDKAFGAFQSQQQSQADKLSITNKEPDNFIQLSTKKQIQVGDSLARKDTLEGKDFQKYMFKPPKDFLEKTATGRKKTFHQKQRKGYCTTELLSGYSLPIQETFANSNVAVVVSKYFKKQYLHRRSTKPHSCEKINDVSLTTNRSPGLPSKERKLFDFVCSWLRNRKRKKRKKIKDHLSDLGVDWRLDVKELNKELDDNISTDLDNCCGTAVVLYSEYPDDSDKAKSFLREFNTRMPEVKIELQDEVSLPGKMLLDVSPYFTRHYIFVLLSQYYEESNIFQHIVNTCLVMSLEDENKRGRVIPVLMTKEDKLPTEFRAIKPVKYGDENFKKKLLPLFKPGLLRSFSC